MKKRTRPEWHSQLVAITLIVLALFASSCNPQKRLHRKAERHIAKAIALDPSVLQMRQGVGTTVVHDTLVVPGYYVADTLVLSLHDTTYIDTGRLQLHIIRLPGEKVYVNAKCKSDTIYRAIPVEVPCDCPPQVVLSPTTTDTVVPWWVYLVIALCLFLLLRNLFAKPLTP